ncbi:hypothetical protein MATL_G00187900 [Megalops atlanticus]|uniref:Homeobox domain-containing protein n=1 Tax=Megalops atlanticus TaxID=7932 RepID=A0A9D3T1J0_MEGAT|nr:hypothetical protein MATL_G00187900 [Megalops atlanticus]
MAIVNSALHIILVVPLAALPRAVSMPFYQTLNLKQFGFACTICKCMLSRLKLNLFYSSSVSENSGYSSGYESEAASSECPSIENDGEKRGTHRRVRTKFTSEQIYKLEKTFNKHKYLDPTERIKTAAKLNLSETQVRTWFQNRRMKLKREVQDWRTENFTPTLLCPTMFPHAPSVQNHSYAGQRLSFAQAPHAIYPPMMQQVPVQQIQQPIRSMMLAPHYY